MVKEAVCRKFRRTASDDKQYNTQFYNLDAIIAVGYRVNSIRATQFRQWATSVLREFAISWTGLTKVDKSGHARTDLIKITSVLSKKTDEEKLKLFKSEKFMIWWIMSSAELIQHWYSIEENISLPVLAKEKNES